MRAYAAVGVADERARDALARFAAAARLWAAGDPARRDRLERGVGGDAWMGYLAFGRPALWVPARGSPATLALYDFFRAHARGDTVALARSAAALRAYDLRQFPDAPPVAALVARAAVLEAAGRPAEAAALLDPMLDDLPTVSPQLFATIWDAGAVPRAFAVRSGVARRLGDAAAATRWARAAGALWASAEPPVALDLARVRQPAGP